MQELTSTRANHLIDPALHVWEWQIPVYLFLGGLVAGMMVISGYFLFSGRHRRTRCACFMLPGLSLILLSVGMFALFLDLEHKLYFWRLYTTFKILSPMSWGSWILMLVYPAIVANLLLRLPAPLQQAFPRLQELSDRLLSHTMFVKWVGALNMFLGSLLGVYTGILISTLAARPLWNSALLGPIFLLSGMSAAAAFVHMIAREIEERELLAQADRTVEQIADAIDQTLANTSHHLRTLARAGLVETTKHGRHVTYRLAGDRVYDLWSALRDVAAAHLETLPDLAEEYLGDRSQIQTIGRAEFEELRRHGAVTIIDVRPLAEYDAGHIPGAIPTPPGELDARIEELPADREIVAYCRGPYCVYADQAVRALRSRGRTAYRLEDGYPEWRRGTAGGSPDATARSDRLR
jgi:formate-dependent nitrite reductase membrane component NrfD/rhodanese-related sulfurtransferase